MAYEMAMVCEISKACQGAALETLTEWQRALVHSPTVCVRAMACWIVTVYSRAMVKQMATVWERATKCLWVSVCWRTMASQTVYVSSTLCSRTTLNQTVTV
jgi:hypothetical protein